MSVFRTHVSPARVDNERFLAVGDDINVKWTTLLPPAEKNAHDMLGRLKGQLGQFGTALGKVRASELTALRVAQDDERDDLFLGLGESIRAATRHRDATKRAAAGRLLVDLDKRSAGLQSQGYDQNTAELVLLFADLDKPQPQADLETLGLLEDWYLPLQAANGAFQELQRTGPSLPDLPLVQPTKRAIARTLGVLLRLGNAYAEEGAEPWVELMTYATDRLATLYRYSGSSNGALEPDPENPEPLSA